MDSVPKEPDGADPKTPLENLQGILAKADAMAAAVIPPETKAVFSIEGDGAEAASDIPVGNPPKSVEIKIEYSENIKKLDELLKAFQMTQIAKGIDIKKNLV